jgi:hypothetical protein
MTEKRICVKKSQNTNMHVNNGHLIGSSVGLFAVRFNDSMSALLRRAYEPHRKQTNGKRGSLLRSVSSITVPLGENFI